MNGLIGMHVLTIHLHVSVVLYHLSDDHACDRCVIKLCLTTNCIAISLYIPKRKLIMDCTMEHNVATDRSLIILC